MKYVRIYIQICSMSVCTVQLVTYEIAEVSLLKNFFLLVILLTSAI